MRVTGSCSWGRSRSSGQGPCPRLPSFRRPDRRRRRTTAPGRDGRRLLLRAQRRGGGRSRGWRGRRWDSHGGHRGRLRVGRRGPRGLHLRQRELDSGTLADLQQLEGESITVGGRPGWFTAELGPGLLYVELDQGLLGLSAEPAEDVDPKAALSTLGEIVVSRSGSLVAPPAPIPLPLGRRAWRGCSRTASGASRSLWSRRVGEDASRCSRSARRLRRRDLGPRRGPDEASHLRWRS